jgi:hypothetical protein
VEPDPTTAARGGAGSCGGARGEASLGGGRTREEPDPPAGRAGRPLSVVATPGGAYPVAACTGPPTRWGGVKQAGSTVGSETGSSAGFHFLNFLINFRRLAQDRLGKR